MTTGRRRRREARSRPPVQHLPAGEVTAEMKQGEALTEIETPRLPELDARIGPEDPFVVVVALFAPHGVIAGLWEDCDNYNDWARLESNQRPPACEAGALPLSYAPSTSCEYVAAG